MITPRHPVGWFELYVDAMPRAKAFDEAMFQAMCPRSLQLLKALSERIHAENLSS